MIKLSIVVPIYNVEQYLRKCVDSLLCQNLSVNEYEILLIDDGSTDNSGQIADDYVAQNKNIKVIHQANAGLSAARNSGIDIAIGKYIMFVDSDDYLEPNVLNMIVEKMEHDNLDVLRFNYQNVNEQGQVFNPNKVDKPFVDFRDEICDGPTFLNERLGGACYAWQFALKRELTSIKFMLGRLYEDMLWTPQIILEAKRITSVDTIVYNYLQRTGSITQTTNIDKKRKALEHKFLLLGEYNLFMLDQTDKRWLESSIAELVLSMLTTIAQLFYADRRNYLKRIKQIVDFPLVDYRATKYARRKLLMINLSPRIYMAIIHFLKR